MDRYDTPNEGDLPSVFSFNGGTIFYGNISGGGKGAGIYVGNNAKCTMSGDASIRENVVLGYDTSSFSSLSSASNEPVSSLLM